MHRRIVMIVLSLVMVAGGFVLSPAGSTRTRAETSSGSSTASATATMQEAPAKCRRCKRIIRKARRCKREGNTSDRCKRLQRKARNCRRYIRTGACKPDDGGGGGAACDPYTPTTEQGKAAETSVVTSAATEAAPIELPIETPPGANGEPADSVDVYRNIQVDSSNGESAGLWVRFEFLEAEDYDIYLNFADGSYAARAAGAPPTGSPLDDNTHGGHTEVGAEQLDGITTDDCGGYTLDMRSFSTPGGEKTLKLWLGEGNFVPGTNPP